MAKIQPVDLSTTRNVFVSAFRFATSSAGSSSAFGNDLKSSAQEQVEFMLEEDEDSSSIVADNEVKLEVRTGLSEVFSSFDKELTSLILDSNLASEKAEIRILQSLSDLEWMCKVLPKMDLMKDFVEKWAEISGESLGAVEDKKLEFIMWGFKVKLVEITTKVLEAVGYGNVILPSPCRVQLLKTWLPYIRRVKPLLDSTSDVESIFSYKMGEDLWQSIEGAVGSFILALPSNDQADIFADWMGGYDQVWYPDLSEAFEVFCFRTKSAKRRLMEGLEGIENATTTTTATATAASDS